MTQRKRKFKVKKKNSSNISENNNKDFNKEDLINKLDNLTAGAKKRKENVKTAASSNRNYYILGGAVVTVIVIGLIAFSPLGVPINLNGNNDGLSVATYTNTCIKSSDNVDIHIHAQLTIKYNDEVKPIPPDTGISATCHSPIHTHSGEAQGRLHVESSSSYNLPLATLGDFFDIWKQPLTTTRVWDYSGTVNVTANDLIVEAPFRDLLLLDGQNIIIDITPL